MCTFLASHVVPYVCTCMHEGMYQCADTWRACTCVRVCVYFSFCFHVRGLHVSCVQTRGVHAPVCKCACIFLILPFLTYVLEHVWVCAVLFLATLSHKLRANTCGTSAAGHLVCHVFVLCCTQEDSDGLAAQWADAVVNKGSYATSTADWQPGYLALACGHQMHTHCFTAQRWVDTKHFLE
jgi:hypothetical protein